MTNLEMWSFLWERPAGFLVVMDSAAPHHDGRGLIHDRKTRYCLGIEDDHLLEALVRRMLDAGVESVKSAEFRPEPTEATRIIEDGLAEGLSREEINRRLKSLRAAFDSGGTMRRVSAAIAAMIDSRSHDAPTLGKDVSLGDLIAEGRRPAEG